VGASTKAREGEGRVAKEARLHGTRAAAVRVEKESGKIMMVSQVKQQTKRRRMVS
jgi:hypothetical protein